MQPNEVFHIMYTIYYIIYYIHTYVWVFSLYMLMSARFVFRI